MEEERLKLRKDEFAVFQAIIDRQKDPAKTTLEEIANRLGLSQSAISPLLDSLCAKNLVQVAKEERFEASLTEEGSRYAKLGLPERRLLKTVLDSGGRAILSAAKTLANLDDQEIQIALGWARKRGWITVEKTGDESVLIALNDYSEDEAERLLKQIGKLGVISDVDPFLNTLQILQNRGLLTLSTKSQQVVELTAKSRGIAAVAAYEVVDEIGSLTSRLLKSGEWKQARLREYDIAAPPPAVYPGRKHPYLEFLDVVRELFLEMGFSEDEGPYVETEFWDFDVLFQPQDHPAREIHDAYRLKHPTEGKLPDEKLVRGIKKAHESAWGYRWSAEIARRLILRTQTTAVSVRHLYTHKTSPLKMFCLSRNFRPDVLDRTHSMEFFHCEGIAMGKGLSFRDLLGFFTEFAHKLGLREVRFRPSYFPFTEPSVEGFVRHPKLGWVEMLAGGLFRPEFLKPLGIKHPVLAWAIGIDRIAMVALGIDDIRELYGRNLQTLRDTNLRWSLCRQ